LIINEFDDYAIEQGILLKEAVGGQVTVIAPNVEGVDDMLFAASARGADRLIKLNGDFESGVNNHTIARNLISIIKDIQPELVLTGVQAHNDLDGSLGPLLAEYLDLPYVGYVAGVKRDNDKVTIRKEYPGGLVCGGVSLPAVWVSVSEPALLLGIGKVRQAVNSGYRR
jgi:electron transfer flavoprotein beta subunit